MVEFALILNDVVYPKVNLFVTVLIVNVNPIGKIVSKYVINVFALIFHFNNV